MSGVETMWKNVSAAVAAALVIAVIGSRPSSYRVERVASIKAPAELVLAHAIRRAAVPGADATASTSQAELTLVDNGNNTMLTWSLAGKKGFGAKARWMFNDVDAIIGKDIQRAIDALKESAEADAAQRRVKAKERKASEAAAAAARRVTEPPRPHSPPGTEE